jgi:hypothetical protein
MANNNNKNQCGKDTVVIFISIPGLLISSLMTWLLLLLCCLVFLVCGGALSNVPRGNFTSPGYGRVRSYSKNLNCEWTLSNPNQGNSSIYIHFVDFSLESHQDCQFDALEFRAGKFNQGICSLIYP